MNWAEILWVGLMVLFLIIEAACPVHLVSVWFAAGSLVAAVIAWLGGGLWLQCVVFLVISVVLLISLRGFLRKHITPKQIKTNVDSIVGTEGLVTATIDNLASTGQVKLGGMEWSARSTSGEVIQPGERIRVDRVEGVKVFVTPVSVTVS